LRCYELKLQLLHLVVSSQLPFLIRSSKNSGSRAMQPSFGSQPSSFSSRSCLHAIPMSNLQPGFTHVCSRYIVMCLEYVLVGGDEAKHFVSTLTIRVSFDNLLQASALLTSPSRSSHRTLAERCGRGYDRQRPHVGDCYHRRLFDNSTCVLVAQCNY
jgi:hypothetical protein